MIRKIRKWAPGEKRSKPQPCCATQKAHIAPQRVADYSHTSTVSRGSSSGSASDVRRIRGRSMASRAPAGGRGRIFTVGHSNHSEPGFFALLTRAGVNGVIDVRSMPHSKRYPHFGRQLLHESCAKRGFGYLWMGDTLGGKAEGGVDAKMATREGEAALARVITLADDDRKWAMMCSEGRYTECHRCKIATKLCGGTNVRVTHIAPDGTMEDHPRPITGFLQRMETPAQQPHQQQHQRPQQYQKSRAQLAEGEDEASFRKRRSKETVRRLKALLSDEAYAEFRAFSHRFQTGEVHVEEFHDTALGFLSGDACLLNDLVELMPQSAHRRSLMEMLRDRLAIQVVVAEEDEGVHINQTMQTSTSSASSKLTTVTVVAIAFHHILDEAKCEALVEWALELSLAGFSKPGTPGAVVIMGDKQRCYEYVSRLRRLKWASMEIRGEWTAAWYGVMDGVDGAGDDETVIVDGSVFRVHSSAVHHTSGACFFQELSTNARGAREAEALCAVAGISHIWEATIREGKGASVSAALKRGAGYSERRVEDARRRERDPTASAMHASIAAAERW